MYKYYKAPNYFNKNGYKSKSYGLTYYDGYGYNYYTGNYGYYEYSRPPVSGLGPYWEVDAFFIILTSFLAVIAFFATIYFV